VIPDVTGMTQENATAKLSDAGFVADPKTVTSTTGDVGTVQSQEPAAGQSASKGSKVVINVIARPVQAAVPNVVGMTKESAQSTITSVGFTPNVVNQVTTPANVGKVLNQTPVGGTLADRGSTVTITVGIAGP